MFTRADCQALDAADPLAWVQERFHVPADLIYLDGNSLGALPKATPGRLAKAIEGEWGEQLIRSWNSSGWMEAPARIGDAIARLVGADAGEVIVADSTTVNLFKLALGALALRPGRRVILAEEGNFPTDLYVLEGIEALLGGRAELRRLPRSELLSGLDDDVALLMLTHIHYKTAEVWPMAEVTAAAHAAGALTLWDLSHSAGAVAVDLNAAGADLAVGCGYKHLNGGPGAPAYVFVARRRQQALRNPIWGWLGHAAPFDFSDDHATAAGVTGQLCGTPAVLALTALECGVASFDGVAMQAVEAKARRMGDVFAQLVESRCAGHGLTLRSPREASRRGAHMAFAHPDGYAIMQALIARGVIGDFRSPDILRFGFTPLYVRYVDLWDAVETLRQVLEGRDHEQPQFRQRAAVT